MHHFRGAAPALYVVASQQTCKDLLQTADAVAVIGAPGAGCGRSALEVAAEQVRGADWLAPPAGGPERTAEGVQAVRCACSSPVC